VCNGFVIFIMVVVVEVDGVAPDLSYVLHEWQ
jgi:hypothetical protein